MTSHRTWIYGFLTALSLFTVACAGDLLRNYGQFNPSNEVTQAFESYTVNPGYRYYYSGSDVWPNAVLGLSREYRLDPKTLWKEVEMTPALMKEFVQGMQHKGSELWKSLYGFQLTDDQGRPIGVWYSILTARTFVHMEADGTVRIDTPPLETYSRFSRSHGHEHRSEFRVPGR